MKNYLISIMVICSYAISHAGQNIDVRKSSSEDKKILIYKTADLNHDGRKDAVVVTEQAGDEQYGKRRTLSVFLADEKNKLHEAIRNSNVIACSKCSSFETEPDPFLDKRISIRQGKISIIQNFDFRFHPSIAIYEFKYQPRSGIFKTVTAKHVLYEVTENGKYKRHISNHIPDFGKTLNSFNPRWFNLIGVQDKFY